VKNRNRKAQCPEKGELLDGHECALPPNSFSSVHTIRISLVTTYIETKSVHGATFEGKDELDGGTVRHVPGADTVRARPQQVFGRAVTARFAFVDTKNRTHAHVAINIGRTVQRIKGDAKLARAAGGDKNGFLIFFRNQNGANSRVDERVDHHVIGQDIQFLLIITSRVDFSRQAVEFGHPGPLNGRRDELARNGQRVEQNHEIVIVRARHYEPTQRFRILTAQFSVYRSSQKNRSQDRAQCERSGILQIAVRA
jgi:hypothetical protein